jgi:hypothetical protein
MNPPYFLFLAGMSRLAMSNVGGELYLAYSPHMAESLGSKGAGDAL